MKNKKQAEAYVDYLSRGATLHHPEQIYYLKCPTCGAAVIAGKERDDGSVTKASGGVNRGIDYSMTGDEKGVLWALETDDAVDEYAASDFANDSPTAGSGVGSAAGKMRTVCFRSCETQSARRDGEVIEFPEPTGHEVTVIIYPTSYFPDDYDYSPTSSSSSGWSLW